MPGVRHLQAQKGRRAHGSAECDAYGNCRAGAGGAFWHRRLMVMRGEMAQAFDLAGVTKKCGWPVLRVFCEGRELGMLARGGLITCPQQNQIVRQHRRPPLRQAQGRLLQKSAGMGHRRRESRMQRSLNVGHPPAPCLDSGAPVFCGLQWRACDFKVKVNIKVNGTGQECPLHTSYSTNRVKPLLEVREPLVAVTVTL